MIITISIVHFYYEMLYGGDTTTMVLDMEISNKLFIMITYTYIRSTVFKDSFI